MLIDRDIVEGRDILISLFSLVQRAQSLSRKELNTEKEGRTKILRKSKKARKVCRQKRKGGSRPTIALRTNYTIV